MIDFDTYQKILMDMGRGVSPRGYTEEMLKARARMEAEFDRFKERVPDAYLHIPTNLEALPNSDEGGGGKKDTADPDDRIVFLPKTTKPK